MSAFSSNVNALDVLASAAATHHLSAINRRRLDSAIDFVSGGDAFSSRQVNHIF